MDARSAGSDWPSSTDRPPRKVVMGVAVVTGPKWSSVVRVNQIRHPSTGASPSPLRGFTAAAATPATVVVAGGNAT